MANDKDFKIKNGLTVDSDTLVVDAANSRVGIGTTNPATPLEVYGQIRTSAAGTNYGVFSGLSGALYMGHRNGANDGAIIFGGYGGGGFTEKMRLTPDGKLGIGSSAPTEALEVVSKGQYNPAIRIEDWGDSAGGAGVGWSRIDLRHSQSTSSEQSIIYVDQNMNFNLLHKDSGRDIIFKTTPAGTGGSSIESLRILSTGNLEVNGSVSDSDGNLRNVIHGSGANISTTPYTVPANSSGAFYQLIAGSGTVTFDAANFARGDIFMIYNNTTSAKTLSFGTFTLGVRLAGDTTNYSGTSSLQVQAYGIATILCPAPNLLVVSGNVG